MTKQFIWEAVDEETFTKLLGLPEFRVVGYALKNQEDIHLYCEHCQEEALCPICGKFSKELYKQEEQCIHDLNAAGRRTFLHVPFRTFDCDHCGTIFNEEIDSIDYERKQTKRFIAYRKRLGDIC